jgi:cell division protein FtsQ
MDGGGRLARSQRSPRPQTDLKAVAIGAVLLLRGLLSRKRTAANPPQQREQPPHRLIAFLERYLPHRAGVAATVLILLGSAAFGIVRGGHVEELTSALSDTRNAMAKSA